ncbi:unnamed protein product [Parnassius apollo]|uniref:(apollo) hypothetical protein n=1 Tax=Parnassius apollo TaxID=110799 RepID=A0A8S3XW47_PARAO|nr:unnamed protein product [Parnassius apollo]
MKGHTKGCDFMEALKKFVEKYGIPVSKMISVCIDGCPSMLVANNDLIALMKRELNIPNWLPIHCLLHQETLIIEWAKCGDGYLSTIPTLLWTFGASAFAHRLITCMFRRFMFRRVTLWEQIVQGATILDEKNLANQTSVEQWLIWLCGAAPLAIYIYTKPRPSSPPIMIW